MPTSTTDTLLRRVVFVEAPPSPLSKIKGTKERTTVTVLLRSRPLSTPLVCLDKLRTVVAPAIVAHPDDWGVDEPERIALAEYLHRRRAEIIAAYPH